MAKPTKLDMVRFILKVTYNLNDLPSATSDAVVARLKRSTVADLTPLYEMAIKAEHDSGLRAEMAIIELEKLTGISV